MRMFSFRFSSHSEEDVDTRLNSVSEEMIIPLALNLCVLPKFKGKGLMSQLISRMHEAILSNINHPK